MQRVRAFVSANRLVLMALFALALCIRAAVPAGYMVTPAADKLIEVSICHGTTGERTTAQIAIPMKADAGGERTSPEAKDTPCAFSGLAQLAIGSTPPVIAAMALAALLALGLAPQKSPAPAAPAYLRPPLRGPPPAI